MRSEEALDTKVLFDPFEEEFDFPTLVIDLGDDCRGDLKVIRQKNESLIYIFSVKVNPSQQIWIGLMGVFAGESNGLVTANTGRPIHRMRNTAAKLNITSGANHKINACLLEAV